MYLLKFFDVPKLKFIIFGKSKLETSNIFFDLMDLRPFATFFLSFAENLR
ncbi:hypothetical protein LEP1GSC067_2642 [Leptospira interrogans serovar Lora str. TE 1992]|uniref:Uncharacterized protein n=1 Tax=Leptospira interrogans serovar Lora str. TE 1992 TaxID=1193028 RepID=M3ETM8_LEPIR|nr:hypothetical protein LEP1GSC067_2642 [Leptospira interrogans serovar Lora str. TE 1992]EMN08443.1 hypothetical protein LEP1GSC053_2694 [Leptospira interrogans serovar Muenchen str. Brem 129]